MPGNRALIVVISTRLSKGGNPVLKKIRSKIADHFDMAYEDMFILGRRVLEQTEHSSADFENQTFEAFTTAEPVSQNCRS